MGESSGNPEDEDERMPLARAVALAIAMGTHEPRHRRQYVTAAAAADDSVTPEAPVVLSARTRSLEARARLGDHGNSSPGTLDLEAEIETLLTPADVAKRLKISRSAACALTHRQCRTVVIARSRTVTRAVLDEFIQSGGDQRCTLRPAATAVPCGSRLPIYGGSRGEP